MGTKKVEKVERYVDAYGSLHQTEEDALNANVDMELKDIATKLMDSYRNQIEFWKASPTEITSLIKAILYNPKPFLKAVEKAGAITNDTN